jgi:GTP cyclohydrolase I
MTPRNTLAQLLIQTFGVDVWDDSPHETARRVLAYWESMRPEAELPFNFTTFPASVQQMILVRNIEFSSLCSHHLLPFYGVVHAAYLPHSLMVGISKIPRLVDYWARRPQVQEIMTHQIASDLKQRLDAKGVAVVVVATHTCMGCRGVRKLDAQMVTSEMRGVFLTDPAPRTEFFNMVGGL